MKDEELAQNIRSAMLKIAENGLGGPQNIQKFHLNLNNLPSLPVFVSNGKFSIMKKFVSYISL